MSDNNPNNSLSLIIMPLHEYIPRKSELRRAYQIRYIVLRNGIPYKKIRPRRFPPLRSIFYRISAYAINENGKSQGEFHLVLHDYTHADYDKRDVPFKIRWDIKCKKETDANTLALHFGHEIHSPQKVLELKLQGCLNDCIETESLSLNQDYNSSIDKLQKRLNAYVSDLGFTGDTKLIAIKKECIAPISIEQFSVLSRTKDYFDELHFEVSLDLTPDVKNNYPHIHMPLDQNGLQELITLNIRKKLKKEIILHEILFNWLLVQNILSENLKKQLLTRGWLIENLVIRLTSRPTPLPMNVSSEVKLAFSLREQVTPIEIRYAVRARLINQNDYLISAFESVEEALKQAITKSHINTIQHLNLYTLCLNLLPVSKKHQDISESVKDEFSKLLDLNIKKFGYELSFFHIDPALPIMNDFKKSIIEIILPEKENQFYLSDSTIKAKIRLKLLINRNDINFEVCCKRITPEEDFNQIILPIIKKSLSSTLLQINTHHYHKFFQNQFIQEDNLSNQNSIKFYTEEKLREDLKLTLGISHCEIDLSFSDTLFSKLFRKIRAKAIAYQFSLNIQFENKIFEFNAEGSFNIDWPSTPEGWLIFQERNDLYTLISKDYNEQESLYDSYINDFSEDIKTIVKQKLEIALKVEFSFEQLITGVVSLQPMRKKLTEVHIQPEIDQTHGVNIHLSPFILRLKNNIHTLVDDKRSKTLINQLDNAHNMLTKAQTFNIHALNSSKIDKQKNIIKEIEKELNELGYISIVRNYEAGYSQEIQKLYHQLINQKLQSHDQIKNQEQDLTANESENNTIN